MTSIRVGTRHLGPDRPSLIVGEVAQAHDGSLGMAYAFIDAVANAGADAVKFQTHIAAAESTPAEAFRVNFSRQDRTRYEYWRRMEFSPEQWHGLAEHARERGLLFLSSPFSAQAVDLLERVGVPAWKIASGEIQNTPLFDRLTRTGLPVLLSSGMSSLAELDRAVAAIRQRQLPLLVLQCTTMYPCPAERVGLNMLPTFRERYGCPVGLSDHSGTIFPALGAVAVGVDLLEVHVTLSREMFGPDVAASVTTGELSELVRGVRFLEQTCRNPVDKDALALEFEPLRRLFFRSVVAERDLPAGTVLEPEHLALKKPGSGMPPERLPALIGRTLRRAVRRDTLLSDDDLVGSKADEPV